MGIALDVLYSREVGLLDAKSAERIVSLLEKLGLAVFASEMQDRDNRGNWQILTGLDEFREHLGGELTVTLLKKIGTGVEVHEMDKNIVIRVVEELQKRPQRK